MLDVGATPADHLGQSHGLQVVDYSVHHLAGHGADFSDYGALQLFGCPWLVFMDPMFGIAPKEEVERTQDWRVRRPLNLLLQADDPAREALLEPPGAWSLEPESCMDGGAGPFEGSFS